MYAIFILKITKHGREKLAKIKIHADFPGSQIVGLSIIKIVILSKFDEYIL